MEYIVDFMPFFLNEVDYNYLEEIEEKINSKISLNKSEIDYFLSCLIFIIRFKVNENMNDFSYKCDLFQSIFAYYFKKLNCAVAPCMTLNVITKDIVGHSFLVVSLLVENKMVNYLIDPSYIQFFKKDNCKVENYYVNPLDRSQVLLTPDPGYFIRGNDLFKIGKLLNNGFIEIDEEIARIYGDSFLNTKRGFTNYQNFQTIPGDVYLNSFLKGKESLSKTEDELKELDLYINNIGVLLKNKNNLLF